MKSADTFNPRYEACGFHPEEVVGRRRDLSEAAKRLYDRLVHWARLTSGERANQRAGEVWRSKENMAEELGKSERQVCRCLARLKAAGLIGWHYRDGRKSNTYFFLFHPDFERAGFTDKTVVGSNFVTSASVQAIDSGSGRPALNGHLCPVGPDLNGHQCPPNQEVPNQKKTSSLGSARLKQSPTKESTWGVKEKRRAFDEKFWPLWPRKVAKADAERAWLRQATSPGLAEEILSALRIQVQRLAAHLEYCPYPANWLNGRRYDDDPEPLMRWPTTTPVQDIDYESPDDYWARIEDQ